jgi:hypothetical protein
VPTRNCATQNVVVILGNVVEENAENPIVEERDKTQYVNMEEKDVPGREQQRNTVVDGN